MRRGRIIFGTAIVATLLTLSLPSEAASGATYSLNGRLTMVPKTNGPWSLDATIARRAGSSPMMPKGARVEASGILALAPTPPSTAGVGPAVATGIYTIRWSNGSTSKGMALCEIARVTICELRNRSGYLKGAQALITGQRNSNGGISGTLLMLDV